MTPRTRCDVPGEDWKAAGDEGLFCPYSAGYTAGLIYSFLYVYAGTLSVFMVMGGLA